MKAKKKIKNLADEEVLRTAEEWRYFLDNTSGICGFENSMVYDMEILEARLKELQKKYEDLVAETIPFGEGHLSTKIF